MMIIDEPTRIGGDAGGASARALQTNLPCGMRRITASDADGVFASRSLGSLHRWLWRSICAVSVDAEEVPLSGIASHEAAIAKVEQHLHGSHEMKAPADPLSQQPNGL